MATSNSRILARWRRRELKAAKALGTKRVHRECYESAPDLVPLLLPCGETVQPEIKTRDRLPALIRDGLLQASMYRDDAVPLLVISETNGPAVAVLLLDDFRRLVGLAPAEPANQQALTFEGNGPA